MIITASLPLGKDNCQDAKLATVKVQDVTDNFWRL